MPKRLSDADQVENASDFIIRKRKPQLVQLVLIFFAAFCVLYLTGINAVDSIGHMVFLSTLIIIIGALACFSIYFAIQTRDSLTLTEFQNALFAGAAGIHSKFCFIVKRDGTIVYYDPGFQKMFPYFNTMDSRSIDALMEQEAVEHSAADQIYNILSEGRNDKIVVVFGKNRGAPAPTMITIDALPRPKGFWVLRGRDFVESRGDVAPNSAPTEVMPDVVSHLLSIVPAGLYATGPEGKIYFINAQLERMLGYGDNEIVTRNLGIQDIIYQLENSRPGSIEVMDFQGEVTLQKKTGALLKAYITQNTVKNELGQITGATAVVQEPLDVKKNSNELVSPQAQHAHSEAYLRVFIENSPIAIARLSTDGTVLESNPSFAKLANTNAQGTLFVTILDESNVKEVQTRVSELMQSPDSVIAPIDVKLRREEPITASLFFTRLDNTDGTAEIIVHLIDTTEQKNLEMRFSHSQKMQAVGQLAGGVAHDFNNLLTAMIGFCDLLLMRHPAGDASFADIMQIKQNANRAANLVRQLLAFSRRQTLQPKILDITDVLAELSNLVRRLIGENIELKMIHGRDVGSIKADQGQMEQVFINLAVNARDAMPKGGTLTIQTSYVSIQGRNNIITREMYPPSEEDKIVNGEYVLVEMIDTGTGIPRDLIQKIFEPFFSTKEVGSGTGLGLATVYGIIKQTGGYIYVSSKEGVGTKFSLFFKRFAQEATTPKEVDATERGANDDLTGKSTILLVEDETPVRIFAARALRNKGYTVLEADCGETALEVFEREGQQVEIIVTDVIMPGINGPTMIEQIRERFPDRAFKVIFMSGYAEDAFEDSFGPDEKFNFLPKPFTLKQLASKVKEVVG
jgi:two-component system cell cycle sensor histidine kinase/response regulator CckA